jgi:plasmid maintenance system killer protein
MPAEMGRLARFVADLLTDSGALVEPIEPEGLEVLAPPALQRLLERPEFCRMGFGTVLPEGAERVGFETDWLERFATVLGERGRWLRRVVAPQARAPSDPERVLDHELVLDNATFRLLGAAPAWTRCLVLSFRYSAVSDEKRDGVLALALNLATGAMPEPAEQLAEAETAALADAALLAEPPAADLPPVWDRRRLLARIRAALPSRLEAAIAPFVKSLHRRLERDQDRLYAYHNDLHAESQRRLAALPPADPARQREEQRSTAIGREYQAKLDDLARQYALHVTAEWVQTLELVLPVQRFTVQIRRRKADRTLHLDWNPLTRRLESPICEATFSAERPRLVCDDALHLVSPAGFVPCSGCGKPFCRACHPERCPKCGTSARPRPHRPP